MSHYDEVLAEARDKASGSAREYIPKLYDILVNEEHKTAEDARKIIEHDLIEYWSRATVVKFLPHEAKDEIKQEAGKKGAEKKKIMLLTDGSSAGKDSSRNILKDPEPNKPDPTTEDNSTNEDEEPSQEELAEINQSLDIPETQTIQNKKSEVQQLLDNGILDEESIFTWLRRREDKMRYFWYDAYGIEGFKNRELAQLKNSGVKVFRRLYFEV